VIISVTNRWWVAIRPYCQKTHLFRANDINVFQGTRTSITKQIHDNDVPNKYLGIHCMAHHTNLVMQTLSNLHLVIYLENLLQTLHKYFSHSLQKHLKFTKFIGILETNLGNKIIWNKILYNVNTRLNPSTKFMAKYKTCLVNMALDNFTN
jgi:hypothetical protein